MTRIVENSRPDQEATLPCRKSGHVVSESIRGGRAGNFAGLRYSMAIDGSFPILLRGHCQFAAMIFSFTDDHHPLKMLTAPPAERKDHW
jgi:hypothetical protein